MTMALGEHAKVSGVMKARVLQAACPIIWGMSEYIGNPDAHQPAPCSATYRFNMEETLSKRVQTRRRADLGQNVEGHSAAEVLRVTFIHCSSQDLLLGKTAASHRSSPHKAYCESEAEDQVVSLLTNTANKQAALHHCLRTTEGPFEELMYCDELIDPKQTVR